MNSAIQNMYVRWDIHTPTHTQVHMGGGGFSGEGVKGAGRWKRGL